MSIKYFAIGFTSYITLATIHGWGDPDVMIAMLIVVTTFWAIYFLSRW